MTNIATLGFDIDTRGLAMGAREAGQFERQLEGLADAADEASAGLRGAGRATRESGQAAERAGAQVAGATRQHVAYGTAVAKANQQMGVMQGRVAALTGAFSGGSGLSGVIQSAGAQAAGLAATLGGSAMVVGAVAGVGAVAAAMGALVQQTAQAQDAMALLQARIQNTMKVGAADAQVLISQMRAVANTSGVSLDATADVVLRLARNNETIGLTRREILGLTQTFQQLGIVSGATSGQIQGALLQLSQALSAGRLNGDELRSIMENMPELIVAIAKGMGVTTGEIKRMGAEGELTTERLVEAFQKVGPEYEQQMREMPMTSARAFAQVGNEWQALMAEMGAALDSSGFVQDIALGLAGGLRSIQDMIAAVSAWTPPPHIMMALQRSNAGNLVEMYGQRLAARYAPPPGPANSRRMGDIAADLSALDQIIDGIAQARAQLGPDEATQWGRTARAVEPKVPIYRDGEIVGTRTLDGLHWRQGMTMDELDQRAQRRRQQLEEERQALEGAGTASPQAMRDRDARLAAAQAAEARALRAQASLARASSIVRQNDPQNSERRQLEGDLRTLMDARRAVADGNVRIDENLRATVAGLDNSIAVVTRRIEKLRTVAESYRAETDRIRAAGAGGEIGIVNEARGLTDQALTRGTFLEEGDARGLVIARRAAAQSADIAQMERAAAQQRALAAAQGEGGEAVRRLEEAQKVANEQFQRFGRETGPAVTEAMTAYAAAVAEAGAAERALADARAQVQHDQQMRQIADVTAAIMAQAGAYAERRAAMEAETATMMAQGRVMDALRARQAFDARESQGAARTIADNARRARMAGLEGRDPITRRQREREEEIAEARRNAPEADRARIEFEMRERQRAEDEGVTAGMARAALERTRQMEAEMAIGRIIGRERQVLLRIEQLINEARQKGIVMDRGEAERIARGEEGIQNEYEREMDRIKRMEELAKEPGRILGDSLRTGFRKAFEEGEINGKYFMNALADGATRMAERMMDMMIFAPLERMLAEIMQTTNNNSGGGWMSAFADALIGYFTGGSGSSSGSAKRSGGGNPTKPSRPIKSGAHGLILEQPTLMAAGGVLVGEAGAEAVFPLRRGNDGRLGIAAGGGGSGPLVQVYDMRTSPGAQPVEIKQRETRDGRRQLEIMVRDAMAGNIRGGDMNPAMRDQFGLGQPVKRI